MWSGPAGRYGCPVISTGLTPNARARSSTVRRESNGITPRSTRDNQPCVRPTTRATSACVRRPRACRIRSPIRLSSPTSQTSRQGLTAPGSKTLPAPHAALQPERYPRLDSHHAHTRRNQPWATNGTPGQMQPGDPPQGHDLLSPSHPSRLRSTGCSGWPAATATPRSTPPAPGHSNSTSSPSPRSPPCSSGQPRTPATGRPAGGYRTRPVRPRPGRVQPSPHPAATGLPQPPPPASGGCGEGPPPRAAMPDVPHQAEPVVANLALYTNPESSLTGSPASIAASNVAAYRCSNRTPPPPVEYDAPSVDPLIP